MAVVSELATGVAGLAKTLAIGRTNGYRAGADFVHIPNCSHARNLVPLLCTRLDLPKSTLHMSAACSIHTDTKNLRHHDM